MRGGAAVGVAEVEGKALRGARFDSTSSSVVQRKGSKLLERKEERCLPPGSLLVPRVAWAAN